MAKYQTKSNKPTRKVLGMSLATAVLMLLSHLFVELIPLVSGWLYAVAILVLSATAGLVNYWVGYTIKPVKRDGVDQFHQ